MARPHHHRRPKPAAQLLRNLVYCVVMFTLWRGPIPWCHIHACDRQDCGQQPVDSVPTGLADHLNRYHHGRLIRDLPHGWHWHYVLPGDSDGDGVAEHDATDLLNPRASFPAASSCDRSGDDWDAPIAPLLIGAVAAELLCPPAPPRLTAEPGGAAKAFRSGLDVRLLAGVILC